MGYNGNNRGRTHKWGGVGNKRDYNWGLNLTSKAMVAPFAIIAALADIEKTSSNIPVEQVETFANNNGSPFEIIKALEDKNDELHKAYRRAVFIKRDIAKIKRLIFWFGLDIFHYKKNKRKRNLLNYVIERRKRLLNPIELIDYGVGQAISATAIKGRVAMHDVPQQSNSVFSLGCLCKKEGKCFHEEIKHALTFSISTRRWQILFFEKAMFVENKNGFVIIPYDNVKLSHSIITNGDMRRTYGYEIAYSTWYHARIDGGPDRRFKENFQIYTIRRYQSIISIMGLAKPLCLILDNSSDYKKLKEIVTQSLKTAIISQTLLLQSEKANVVDSKTQ